MSKPEVWLRGPLNDMPGLLQPVAHALLQAREEINDLMQAFPEELLWERPAGLASPGFHLQHMAGVINRIFTYAKGGQLNQEQLDTLNKEGKPEGNGDNLAYLLQAFSKQVDDALIQLRETDVAMLEDKRGVGRAMLPSTVIGLYVHAAEHTMRHAGQLLATVKVLNEK
ncbi:MAG: DinB superfamily protein [Mucilaginibacter sp.]|nr:DinB superfamily protein [Mucilaginibacter sp.]